MMRMKVLGLAVLWAMVFTLRTAQADTEQPNPELPAQKANADAAMIKKNYAEALELYQQIYAKTKDPALLYNQGRAFQALHRMPEALEMLQRFSTDAPSEIRAKVPKLTELIKEVQDRVCILTVRVNVSGATVRLRNVELTPDPVFERPITAGKAELVVSKPGFETEKRTVSLPGGKAFEISVDLFGRDKSGILAITSNVDGTSIAIDGRPYGQTPTEVRVPAGQHTISATATEYEEATVVAVVGVGERKAVEVRLGSSPFYEQAWFWTVTGVLVAGGAATGISYAVLTERDPDKGSIDPGQLPASAKPSYQIVISSPLFQF